MKNRKIEFIDDDDAIRQMTKLGIKFTIKRGPVSNVDREWSRSNHSRFEEPLDIAHAELLAEYARQGNPFKRSVCLKRDDGQLGILGGNHRDEGYVRAGVTEFEYYLIDTEGLSAFEYSTALPRLLNSLPFKPLSTNDKVRTALWWDILKKQDLKQSAAMLGLKYEYLQQRKKHDGVLTLLQNAKVTGLAAQKDSTRFSALAALGLDSVKLAASLLCIKADYTKTEVQALANTLRKCSKDEATQLAYIKRVEERLALDKDNGKEPQAERTTWLRNFGAALKLMAGKSKLGDLGVTKEYKYYDDLIKDLNLMCRLCRVLSQG